MPTPTNKITSDFPIQNLFLTLDAKTQQGIANKLENMVMHKVHDQFVTYTENKTLVQTLINEAALNYIVSDEFKSIVKDYTRKSIKPMIEEIIEEVMGELGIKEYVYNKMTEKLDEKIDSLQLNVKIDDVKDDKITG